MRINKDSVDYILTLEDIAIKGHFCPEWDFIYIDETFIEEFKACNCFYDFKEENLNGV